MRLAFGYDTETTGLPLYKDPSEDPRQPHIVQAAGVLVCLESRLIVASFDVIVKPDGWQIPADTTEVHGITQERAEAVGVPEDLVVDMLYAMAGQADHRFAFNESFDARIVRIGLKRQGDEAAAEAFKAQPAFCTMRAAHKVLGGKWPKLSVAHQELVGRPIEGAHSAMGDTLSALNLYWALTDRGMGYAGDSDSVGLG